MKRFLIQKKVWLTAAAVVLAGGISLQGAMAYFTTYASAGGGAVLDLGHTTEIEENVNSWQKAITIRNTGDVNCYIRVKVLAGSLFGLDISGKDWSSKEDGYWYYSDPVAPDGKTKVLTAQIIIPEDYKEAFNVSVVQECTPVLYDDNGNPYADWNLAIDEGGTN